MFGLGMQELVIILLIVLVLFGASKLPQMGKGLGEAIRNFKKAALEAGKEERPSENTIPGNTDGKRG
jgi:sec-independent protein translocase protein TatA